VLLTSMITTDTVLQWHLSSIGTTVSFTWEYPLYVWEPVHDRPLYARFSTYLPLVDLSSRGSALFDHAYAYHNCASSESAGIQLADATSYPECKAKAGSEPLSDDDFYIDINLLLGIPVPIKDLSGAGGWQAWELGSTFSSVAEDSPNCTGSYADNNVAPNLWAWGFWSGKMPYVCNTKGGYDPYGAENGVPSQWLAEYGVTHGNELLPAFAFSMMPKMIPMLSPGGLGANFPSFVMGVTGNALIGLADSFGMTTPASRSLYMEVFGDDFIHATTFYSHALYTTHVVLGSFIVGFAIFPTLIVGIYRHKVDASS